MDEPKYSFVIPIYNEEETLPELKKRLGALLERLDGSSEVILVDDGSDDKSYSIMLDIHQQDPRFKIVRLSRNFGHQIAITTGMDFSIGQAVIILDADLQDPPEVILKMIERWEEGFEIVYAIRENREGETWFKRITASVFYRCLRKLTEIDIPSNVGDFRLVDRKTINVFKTMRESNRYVRGMFSWVGFKQTGIRYMREKRFAGYTKYPLKKMLKLAVDAIINFSTIPLRLVLGFGFVIAGLSFFIGITAIYLRLSGVYMIRGWTSLVVLVSFFSGIQLIVVGMLGEYVSRIYLEVKNRPLYIVSNLHGFKKDE
ncbi:MAG: glycosyltransferase family 2 protein [Planctomycetia bacterium]|uniref:glycosyltransferase family 2 protein n=1 Tax=Candidatus Kuenenia sp. TaxID=2499824 RepID=UPI001DF42C02|nr:glycosyltransferase family 2 protein [Planctomycetia bacterium]MCF6152008.1 glycosyltransferase [Candidatus Kuenenia stuttgartiensis]